MPELSPFFQKICGASIQLTPLKALWDFSSIFISDGALVNPSRIEGCAQ